IERSRAGGGRGTKRNSSARHGEKETARSRHRRTGKNHRTGAGRLARALRAHRETPQRHGHGRSPRWAVPRVRYARAAAYSSGASHGNQRRSLPLRKLRPHPLHPGTDSHRKFRCWLRKFNLGGFDKFLMPRRPPTPRGKNLFGQAPVEPRPAAAAHRINIDGGSRGNPGPASYGVVIRDGGGEIVAKLKKYIGRMTNNVAEYYGLIAALDYAESHGVRALRIESDSELLVKQMRGLYKVKSEDLRPLFERAQKMSKAFEPFRIEHVYREHNREADALANDALHEPTRKNPGSPAAKKTEPSGLKAASPNSKPILPNAKPEPASSKPEPAGSKPEPRKIQARFRGGVLYLLEDVELPDGMAVDGSIHLRPKPVV